MRRALNGAHRARHSRSGSGPLASLGLHGPSARQASRRSLRRAGPSRAHASRARPRSQTARARPARVRRSLRGFVLPRSGRCSAHRGPCISGPALASLRARSLRCAAFAVALRNASFGPGKARAGPRAVLDSPPAHHRPFGAPPPMRVTSLA